jgi:hypothetical protein
MTTETLASIIGLITIVGAAFGYWRYFEGQVSKARDKADKVGDDLAQHRLHVAETYMTKMGMREIKEEVLTAVSGIRDDVRHLVSRIDTMHDAAVKPRPRKPPEN